MARKKSAETINTEDVDPVENKRPAERTPLNHATEHTETIGGMEFRRQRGALDQSDKRSLDIPERFLNTELNYRWVNDHNGLIESRRDMGYEVVPDLSGARGEKVTTRRRVGTNKDGSPLYAQLMATPKKWKAERDAAAATERKAQNLAIAAGQTDGREALGKDFYVKDGHNKIET
jgi:hypothetical protein